LTAALSSTSQGAKGVVSVDYRLTGRKMVLRPSMIKYEAAHFHMVEIAQTFDKPGPFYLNRPLIMVLEG
jgi:RNA-dependent RNA polymerase